MAEIITMGTPSSQMEIEYTPSHDDNVVLYFGGSAYASEIGTIGFSLSINGSNVGMTTIYANAINSHMTLNPTFIKMNFEMVMNGGAIAPVKIVIEPVSPNTKFDTNDNVSLVIL